MNTLSPSPKVSNHHSRMAGHHHSTASNAVSKQTVQMRLKDLERQQQLEQSFRDNPLASKPKHSLQQSRHSRMLKRISTNNSRLDETHRRSSSPKFQLTSAGRKVMNQKSINHSFSRKRFNEKSDR